MSAYRFGKHPPKQDYRTLRLKSYLTAALAPPPSSYDVLAKVYQKLDMSALRCQLPVLRAAAR